MKIAFGGAAAAAHMRLLSEELEGATRSPIKLALLGYCELDTFAMAMLA